MEWNANNKQTTAVHRTGAHTDHTRVTEREPVVTHDVCVIGETGERGSYHTAPSYFSKEKIWIMLCNALYMDVYDNCNCND